MSEVSLFWFRWPMELLALCCHLVSFRVICRTEVFYKKNSCQDSFTNREMFRAGLTIRARVHIPPESLEHKLDYRLFTSGPRWPSRSLQLQSKLRHVSVRRGGGWEWSSLQINTLSWGRSLSLSLCFFCRGFFFMTHWDWNDWDSLCCTSCGVVMPLFIMCCGGRVPLERPVCPVPKGQRWADQSCFLLKLS